MTVAIKVTVTEDRQSGFGLQLGLDGKWFQDPLEVSQFQSSQKHETTKKVLFGHLLIRHEHVATHKLATPAFLYFQVRLETSCFFEQNFS